MPATTTADRFEEDGYLVCKDLFTPTDLIPILSILTKFHAAWTVDNSAFYNQKAVNSAYITSTHYLNKTERLTLFNFITQNAVMNPLVPIIPTGPAFVGTQLFFNPVNQNQNNYWHRDMQYNGEPIEQQKENLKTQSPLHVRIALRDEPGIEVIPGTHKRWDTAEEFNVRMELNGHKNHDSLKDSHPIALQAGDMVIFSANIIHRGLYGMDRFAFDLLFTDQNPALLKFADLNCLPDMHMLKNIQNPEPYERTLRILGNSGHQ